MTTIKKEPLSADEIESRLLELARNQPDGISNNDLKETMPNVPLTELTGIINKLLKNGTLELFRTKDSLLYKFKDPSKKTAVKGSDNEEKVVYKIIEEAGNKGIWIRDIRFKSNLNMTQLNKVLKSLEAKKIIKAVKSVAASKKKVYMLYDLEPDNTVTGGAWYQDQDFESEFVDVLSQQCLRFLQQKQENAVKQGGGPLLLENRSYASASEVQTFIKDLGISKVTLSIGDIESILYTLVLDGSAVRTASVGGKFVYKTIQGFLGSGGLVSSCCGMCPNEGKCATIGSINPNSCVYISDWVNGN